MLADANITIHMKNAPVQALPCGNATTMWTYDGTFPGPTIRRPGGQATNVTFVNDLTTVANGDGGLPAGEMVPGAMTVHRHGGHQASVDDGQVMNRTGAVSPLGPDHSVSAGTFLIPSDRTLSEAERSRRYHYPLMEGGRPEAAATEWYHDHSMHVSDRNVYMGLAGMFIVDGNQPPTLPKDHYDVPLALADRDFDAENRLVYTQEAFAKRVLVNGAVQPYLDVTRHRYRFRVLNASGARSYRLEFKTSRDGTGPPQTMTQIASESGLLPRAVPRSQILLGPGERTEVVVDFGGLPAGAELYLLDTDPLATPDGSPSALMQYRVQGNPSDPTTAAADDSSVPDVLCGACPGSSLPEFSPNVQRMTWVLNVVPDLSQKPRPVRYQINGQDFDPERVDYAATKGVTQLWTFINATPIPHVMHIHDVDWKVVSRVGAVTQLEGLPQHDPTGLTLNLLDALPGDLAVLFGAEQPLQEETGLKESVRVRPFETVQVMSRFTDYTGLYMMHCHILNHEDHEMMAQFKVVEPPS
ncbi:MAG TPA: multicopper oxidase family protein [Acidimicrobiia bacterium]|nr:multicopper oxidase family protein [Acidimicrobiia bacterium]